MGLPQTMWVWCCGWPPERSSHESSSTAPEDTRVDARKINRSTGWKQVQFPPPSADFAPKLDTSFQTPFDFPVHPAARSCIRHSLAPHRTKKRLKPKGEALPTLAKAPRPGGLPVASPRPLGPGRRIGARQARSSLKGIVDPTGLTYLVCRSSLLEMPSSTAQ